MKTIKKATEISVAFLFNENQLLHNKLNIFVL